MDDCIIIILGITGDLARRKLIPAIHTLVREHKIKNPIIVGAAPEEANMQAIFDDIQKVNAIRLDDSWRALEKKSSFVRLDALNKKDFVTLASHLDELEKQLGHACNRLLYCAVPPDYFCAITQQSVDVGIIKKHLPSDVSWHRIVYEKPFGNDYESAKEINECIARHLGEQQVFRVDHYLSEELISSLAIIRFTNAVFEPLWNKTYVDQIHLYLDEEIGIEGRGAYYDHYGALKDVVQNHLLELLALVAMEAPSLLTGEDIRQERARVLQKIKVHGGILGQYQGYLHEKGVAKQSKTETFALLKLSIDNERWQGVPIFIRTGKCLAHKQTSVHLFFKNVKCPLQIPCPEESNCLKIRIKPDPIVSLQLNVKKPGSVLEAVPVQMEFCHNCIFKEESAAAYERLFEAVMRGEPSVSVRFDEIEDAWRVIEQIKKLSLPMYLYECGSMGPNESDLFGYAKKG